ncbi:hypothetical protein [Scytonema sp. PCC 10023]|uniref:hypothetical protein n=1 Tax=Scytonema sp. PCC 10023 TaxID=1680591 RepID=UPI0039C74F17
MTLSRAGGGFKPALRVRHLLYLGKPQDRSGSPPTLMPTARLTTNGALGGGLKHAKDETDN